MKHQMVTITNPDWVENFLETFRGDFSKPEERVRLAVELARRNFMEGTGGPFGAAVFELESHRLISTGVNRVTTLKNSVLHAEIIALMMAQKALEAFELGSIPGKSYELVSSTEPCAMCLGAVPWSGVRRLVCGALDADARAIGFDEGPKPADWTGELRKRGIEVLTGVYREEAVRCLEDYQKHGGIIYNATRN